MDILKEQNIVVVASVNEITVAKDNKKLSTLKVSYEPTSVSCSLRGHIAIGGSVDNKVISRPIYELLTQLFVVYSGSYLWTKWGQFEPIARARSFGTSHRRCVFPRWQVFGRLWCQPKSYFVWNWGIQGKVQIQTENNRCKLEIQFPVYCSCNKAKTNNFKNEFLKVVYECSSFHFSLHF